MAKNRVYITEFDASGKPYFRTLDQMEKKTYESSRKIDESFKKIGAGIATYFGGREILQFAMDSVQLATKLQGVKTAFDKLKDSQSILERLRKATQGTVTEFQLMQSAVKADNFKIPLNLLAKGLDFANKRAIQTGESVDYMVDSFITGVARKSIPILDNLGISQLELNKEIEKTGDFYTAIGNIVERENIKMSGAIDETVMAQQRLNAQLENTKTALGTKLIPLYENFLKMSNELLTGSQSIYQFFTGGSFMIPLQNDARMKAMFGNSGKGPNVNMGWLTQNQITNSPFMFAPGKTTTPNTTGTGKQNNSAFQMYLSNLVGADSFGDATGKGLMKEKFTPSFIGQMNEVEVPELADKFESISQSFVDVFSDTQNIANQVGRIFNVSADSFVGKLMQAFDVGSSILSIIASVANIASGGPITSLFGLAEGGTVINKNGKLSYTPIPKFARGGTYIVPPGYSNDSGLIRVQSGERVDVTPSHQVPMISKMLGEIKGAILAGNMNSNRKGSQPIVVYNVMDGEVVSKNVTRHQNRMQKAGKNFGDLD